MENGGNQKQCRLCGRENPESAVFCAYCGGKLEEIGQSRFCSACGTECDSEMLFCPACGQKLTDLSDGTQVNAEAEPPKEPMQAGRCAGTSENETFPQEKERGMRAWLKRHRNLVLLVRDGALVALCALLVLFSFLPMVRLDKEATYDRLRECATDDAASESIRKTERQYTNVEIRFSGVEFIGYALGTFRPLEDADLKESREYRKMMDLVNDVEELYQKDSKVAADKNFVKISKATARAMERAVHAAFACAGRSEEMSGSAIASFRTAGFAALLYLLTTSALLLLSLVNLIRRLVTARSTVRPVLAMLAAVPFLTVGVVTAIRYAIGAGTTGIGLAGMYGLFGYGALTCATGTAVATIVLCAVVTVATYVVSLARKPKGEKITGTVLRMVATAVCILITVGTFCMPILTQKLNVVPQGRDTKTEIVFHTDSRFGSFLCLTKDERIALAETAETMTRTEKSERLAHRISSFSRYTKKQLNAGIAESDNDCLMLDSVTAGGQYDNGIKYCSLVYLLPFFITIAVSLVSAFAVSAETKGKGKTGVILAKVFLLLFAAAQTALTVILWLTARESLVHYEVADYSVSLGMGTIFVAAAALILAALPVFLKSGDGQEEIP